MLKLASLAIVGLLVGVPEAGAVVPLVNPVTVFVGNTVHVTPVDQTGTAIPIAQCTLFGLSASYATSTKDATGFNIKGVNIGSTFAAFVSCTDGVTTVKSATFTVNVTLPPYIVTEVGTTLQ